MANQFLSLSLFLMLLSFFIVMNSVSGYEEEKEKSVLNSIALAFSNNKVEGLNGAPSEISTPRMSINQGETLVEIEGLFDASISGFEATKNRLGTVMHVRTPIAKFENALDSGGSFNTDMNLGEKGSFTKTLVTLLRSEERGQPFRIDMILNTEQDPIELHFENNDDFMKYLYRVTALSNRLEQQGVPIKMMSAGLVKGEVGYIDLYFHKYKPFKLLNDSQNEGAQ
ncbi:MAG: hypothetical protein ACRBDI_02730 [Alphaproteobacteria bacterium]